MTYEVWDFWAQALKKSPDRDPRTFVAEHIGWTPSTTTATLSEWSLPEPNNYNRAVRALRPVDCPFVKNIVYYKKDGKWWSLYHVTENLVERFKQWLETVDIEVYWYHNRQTIVRRPRTLLHARKNQDITENERLYTMGYYSRLGAKYFSEDDTMLLERLGPVRTDILEGVVRFDESLTDTASDFDMLI